MPSRREREEALIAESRQIYKRNGSEPLAAALEAAHRREDGIRALPSWTHPDCPHNDVRARTLAEVLAILDRENA